MTPGFLTAFIFIWTSVSVVEAQDTGLLHQISDNTCSAVTKSFTSPQIEVQVLADGNSKRATWSPAESEECTTFLSNILPFYGGDASSECTEVTITITQRGSTSATSTTASTTSLGTTSTVKIQSSMGSSDISSTEVSTSTNSNTELPTTTTSSQRTSDSETFATSSTSSAQYCVIKQTDLLEGLNKCYCIDQSTVTYPMAACDVLD